MKAFSGRAPWWVALFVLLLCAAAAGMTGQVQAQDTSKSAPVHGFELLDAQAGWVWHGDDLDWSPDGGVTWRRITPGEPGVYQLADVYFASSQAGWALLAHTAPPTGENPPLVLARTADAGATWRFAALPQPLLDVLADAKTVRVLPAGSERGSIAAELATSSNFSRGALWYTNDGGATWQERALPLGEAVQFAPGQSESGRVAAEQIGWLAGGPGGDELWRTVDGGATWERQPLPHAPLPGERIQVYTPLLAADDSAIVLPLLIRSEAGQAAVWYSSRNGGATWELVRRQTVQAEADAQASDLADQDARAWLVRKADAIVPPVQPLPYFVNTALGDGSRLVQVKMATPTAGWALAERPDRRSTLLATHDGGQTWQPLALPLASFQAELPAAAQPQVGAAASAPATVERTTVVRGHGFDICNLPAVTELAAWYEAGPYRSVNLYIGGVLRFCKNEDLSVAKLSQLSAQGWTFIPTWVGPQAPCTSYRSRFSSDPNEAYSQGAAEADAALAVAAALGLADEDGAGTIIYYDLEAYDGSNEACVAAAQAFISGWSSRLRERGSQSGLYSSACNPPMGRYAAIAAPPDAIWMAAWNRNEFDAAMTVWDISCIDNSLWARSQRIRQYANSHDETWGGVTLEIDNNVLDSIVADLGPAPAPIPTPTATPQPSVLLETPGLDPGYEDGMCGAGWHLLVNERGYPAYLAANRSRSGTIPPGAAEMNASWEPAIPADGFYRVEAYIPSHAAVAWLCPEARLAQDTETAHYTVRHADDTVTVVRNQAAGRGGWLLLGVYPFRAGLPAQVTLATATAEEAYTRTVAASALRVTRVENGVPGSHFLYLPQLGRR